MRDRVDPESTDHSILGYPVPSPTSLLYRSTPVVLGLLALLAVGRSGSAANPGATGFPLDDAWIHLVYGRGLLENGFLAYEDGVPSTGATSPLWAILLAAVHAIVPGGAGTDGIVRAVRLLGALLQLGGITVAASLTERLARDRVAGLVAGGLVALAVPMAVAAYSGMEVGLAALLLLLGTDAALRGAWGRAGVWLALAGATRPECAAVIALGAAAAAAWSPAPRRLSAVGRFLAAPVAVGAAFVAYDLWASGAPLPSAFYAKSSFTAGALPGRAVRAVTGILSQAPPFGTGVAWLAVLGWWPFASGKKPRGRRDAAPAPSAMHAAAPGIAAAAFLLANLALIDPVDPAAFYHVRYLLPAVPVLLVSLALGTVRLGALLPARWRTAPVIALGALSIVGAAASIVPASRHLHNDVRNINEVQRRIGDHLHDTLPADTRIATSDAGAVRYFSRLPTTDVTGLNTPAMRHADDAYLRTHAARALVLLPAWYRTPDAALLEETFRAGTENYTVTSNPAMALQVVLRLKEDAAADGGVRRVRFAGFHPFAIDLAR